MSDVPVRRSLSIGKRFIAGVLFAASALGIGAVAMPSDAERTLRVAPAKTTDDFMAFNAVLTHPRCQNCHTLTEYPRQGDDRRPHIMGVLRGRDGHGVTGLECGSCHGRSNALLAGVPGADEDWHLAPLSMGWEGKNARGDLPQTQERSPPPISHSQFIATVKRWVESGTPCPADAVGQRSPIRE